MMNAAIEDEVVVGRKRSISSGSALPNIESPAPYPADSAGLIRFESDPVTAAYCGQIKMTPRFAAGGVWVPHLGGSVAHVMTNTASMMLCGYQADMAVEDDESSADEVKANVAARVEHQIGRAHVGITWRHMEDLLQNTRVLTTRAFGVSHANYNAIQFIAALPNWVEQPRVYFGEDNDVVLEWKSSTARVLVTFEGDDTYGYAIKVGGRFVPGNTSVSRADEIPADLLEYLHAHFNIDVAGD